MSGTEPPGKRTRIQLDLSERALKQLEEINALCDHATRAETIRRAVALFYWLKKNNIYIVISHGPDGKELKTDIHLLF